MRLPGPLVSLVLAVVMLVAAGLYLGFAPTYVSDLIPGHSPTNCGSAFLPRDACGSDIGTGRLRGPAIALLVASALFVLRSITARRQSLKGANAAK